MNLDRSVTLFAGIMVLVSVILTQFVSPYWYWFTAFVGANLLQSAFTGTCPLVLVLRKIGVRSGAAF